MVFGDHVELALGIVIVPRSDHAGGAGGYGNTDGCRHDAGHKFPGLVDTRITECIPSPACDPARHKLLDGPRFTPVLSDTINAPRGAEGVERGQAPLATPSESGAMPKRLL